MLGYHTYKTAIDACLKCAAICNHCASTSLQEENINMMAKCVQLTMECATLCYTTAKELSLGTQTAHPLMKVCADLCEACAAECGKHETVHCRECADACRECAEACRTALTGGSASTAEAVSTTKSVLTTEPVSTDESDLNRTPTDPEIMHADYGSSGAAPVGAFDTSKS